MELRGTVRFRFRAPEHEVDVLLEGDAGWVSTLREEMDLSGDVGVLQPLAARLVESDEPEPESAMGGGDEMLEEMPLPEEAVRWPLARKRCRSASCSCRRASSFSRSSVSSSFVSASCCCAL